MRYLAIGLLLLASSVLAEERVFGLDGSVYLLQDGKYQKLSMKEMEGRINFHFNAATNEQGQCKLRLVLTNSTKFTIRKLDHAFNIFSRRQSETIYFGFGGRTRDKVINPGSSAEYENEFEKGVCSKITGAEPYTGRVGSGIHIDGLSESDAKRLFNYPDIGLLTINLDGG